MDRLLVMAKEPLPGLVKTRIAASLGDEFAVVLAEQLLQRTMVLCGSFLASSEKGDAAVHWYIAPNIESDYWHQYSDEPVSFHPQGKGDLGARLTSSVQSWVEQGDHVVCIGMDCPQLELHDITAAFKNLQSYDGVLQPAIDGGYVLLGIRQWRAGFFDHINWSTPEVAQQTRQRFQACGLTYVEHRILSDVDYVDDIPAQLRLRCECLLQKSYCSQ